MLPLVAVCFTSCEKNNGNNGELSGDDVIEFKDANFLKALLTVQEIGIYDADIDDYVDYLVDVDVNKDGAITVNEAQAVICLALYDYDRDASFYISEMPEIKYFTRLEYLDCSYNRLTSLDISNNIALEELRCDDNELTSLDVSSNTAMIELSCGYNQLTSLDLSKNTALERLYCYGNQLKSLDVSSNMALESLYCSSNQLTSLDVSNNTALGGLDCSGNQLTSLDVSNNTALGELGCSDNQLTYLDVHYNQGLRWLYCSKNPLQKLILYTYHNIADNSVYDIESEYGDIIEYME